MTQAALFGDITFNITAASVAWYAAVISTFSAVKAIVDMTNDRRRVKLSYRDDVTIENADAYGYESGERQFCIEVVNSGKRPIKLTNAGYFTKDGMKHILSDSINPLRQTTRTLTDLNPSTEYFCPAKKIKINDVWYIYVLDATGKNYKKYLIKFGRFHKIPAFFIRRNQKKLEKKK